MEPKDVKDPLTEANLKVIRTKLFSGFCVLRENIFFESNVESNVQKCIFEK